MLFLIMTKAFNQSIIKIQFVPIIFVVIITFTLLLVLQLFGVIGIVVGGYPQGLKTAR